jgi:hypothetical protein
MPDKIVEVCTGPGLARPVGPGITDYVWVRVGLGPSSNDSNQTLYRTFRAFSGHFFPKEKFIRNCSQLRKKKTGAFTCLRAQHLFLVSIFSTFFNIFWSVRLYSWNYLLCFGIQIVTCHSHKLSLLNFHECLLYRSVEMQKTRGLYRL